MAMSLPSFDYAGLSYIVREFDRRHGLLPGPDVQQSRAIVMHQLQRHFHSKGLPIEVIDIIFQNHLSSVSDLLMFYRGSPAIHNKSPLLLYNIHNLNSAAEHLLKQLNFQIPQREAFSHLMVRVLTHYFKRLPVDKKIVFIMSSQITVWENRSLTEKIQLLGRVHITSLSNALRVISWKVQFIIIKILEKNFLVISFALFGMALVLPLIVLVLSGFFGLSNTAFIQKLGLIWISAMIYTLAFFARCLAFSLLTAALGRAAQISWFSQSTRDKGAWIQALSLCCVKISFHSLLVFLSLSSKKNNESVDPCKDTLDAYEELTHLLSQSINEANLNLNQQAFVDAYLPELNQRWLQIANQ